MQAILHEIQSQLPGIIALLIINLPGVIVALTAYPKEQGWAKNVLTVLQLFSALTHKDSPSTLKLPLTLSKPPPVIGNAVVVVK
jgi:hypothetical protein